MELFHRILDGKGMPEDWTTCVAIPISKGKGDIIDCGMYMGVQLLEHAKKMAEKVHEKRLIKIATIDDLKFGFMSGKGTIDAVVILRRIQEEYLAKQEKLYMSYIDLEDTFDRVRRKFEELAMRKKGIPDVLVTAVMSMCTKVQGQ